MLNTMQFPTMFGQNGNNPYMDNRMPAPQMPQAPMQNSATSSMPQPMMGDMSENSLYPFEGGFNNPQVPTSFAKGGRVKKKQSHNPYPSLAEMIRQQGQGEDSILAHINPQEAMMLKQMGGSGTINKKTGLPQFGFFNKPGKALRSIAGGAGGAIIGNMILPGIGGVIGGALGQGIQHKSRGKSFAQGALKGGMMGAGLPSAASLAGSGASAMGMNTAGNFLSNYGTSNAILPALGMGGGSEAIPTRVLGSSNMSSYPAGGSSLSSILSPSKTLSGAGSIASNPLTQQAASGATNSGSFSDMLMSNSKNFLSKPKNLLTLASTVGSMANKPKEKSPEKLAQEQKRYLQAMMLSPAERAAMEADKLAERQMERRIARNQYLPEERFETKPTYRRASTPEEYKKTGRWLNYYNNPEFSGNPLTMKHGGQVPQMIFEREEIIARPSKGTLLKGNTKGQDDKIESLLSDGEYVVPADVVSHLGDGNSIAGGKECDNFVKNVRKSKGMPNKLPPKAKSILNYMR
jgi:hypothetical protein